MEHKLAEWGDVLAVKTFVQSARTVPAAVAQVPGALGITALAHVTGLVEMIVTDDPLYQPLSLVTRGQPTLRMIAVIEAARAVAGWEASSGDS